MLKNMKLGTKLACGFGIIVVISIALGAVAIWSMRNVEQESLVLAREFVPQVEIMVGLQEDTRDMMYELRGYGYTSDNKFLEAGKKAAGEVKQDLGTIRELAAKSPHLLKLKEVMGTIENQLLEYDNLIGVTQARVEGLVNNRKAMDEAAAQYMKHAHEYLEEQSSRMAADIEAGAEKKTLAERLQKITLMNEIIDLGNGIRLANFKAQVLRDSQVTQEALGTFEKIEQKLAAILAMTTQEATKKQLADIVQTARVYKKGMTDPSGNYQALLDVNNKRRDAGNGTLAITKEITHTALQRIDKTSDEVAGSLASASRLMILGLCLAVLLGAVLAFTITRGITKPINRVVKGLTDSADQVASASSQVASSAQSLAEGASEQAAGIEETSSSMEEMSSMTRQNAENANQANGLMGETSRVIADANRSMGELRDSMQEISAASEETAKIIKTIDEIAFQTNLLALNAAVEAARAGEAGAGFAVVADEVRNLAMRAAEAAKNTADLIEGTVKKIKIGSDIVGRTNEAFAKVASGAQRVEELVGEISAASSEQSQGIEQINVAVTEMDKIVQQNASGAEEAAAAAEQMNAQAEQMKQYVHDLASVVGGGKQGGQRGPREDVPLEDPDRLLVLSRGNRSGIRDRHALPKPSGDRKGNGSKATGSSGITELHPSKVIPFDDADLSNF